MKKEQLQQAIIQMEEFLRNFKEAKEKGQETNSNHERAQSISEIEEITGKLETFFQNNKELLKLIAGKDVNLSREIKWSDIVRPAHFEEDLQAEINKLKEMYS